MNIITASFNLFLLRKLPFDQFNFSVIQSWTVVILLGVLVGFDPANRESMDGAPEIPLAILIIGSIVFICVGAVVIWAFLRWWMQRGQRWNGEGKLFNLMVASWLIPDGLASLFTAMGAAVWSVLPLWFYSIWVGVKALNNAMPSASLGYTFAGISLATLLAGFVATAVSILLMVLLGGATA
jgi:hypothetical protein